MRERWPSDALLRFIDRLYDAAVGRETETVRALLRSRIASHLPREAREDALATARASGASFRAPVRLLQFRHRMAELSRDEPVPPPAGQLELELRPRGATRVRRTGAPPGRAASEWKRRRGG